MPPITRFTKPVPEGSSRQYDAVLKDHTGAPIDLAVVSSLKLTLTDVVTGAIVNNRDEQSVLNANGGTLASTGGAFSMVFSALDTAIIGTLAAGEKQARRATFALVYASGAENHEVLFLIQNLADVP